MNVWVRVGAENAAVTRNERASGRRRTYHRKAMRRFLLPFSFVIAGLVACGSSDATPSDPPGETTEGAPGSSSGSGTTPINVGGSSGAPGSSSGDGGSSGAPGTPTAGCGAAPAQSGFANGLSIQVDGQARTYALFVPTSYDPKKPYPLVFAFHGDGGSGAGIRTTMKLEDQAQGAAIFVYPDGLSKTWDLDSPTATNKDYKFITALVDKLAATYCTDQTRRFLTGFSRGAYFTNQLGCRSPREWRAVAPHSGGGPYGLDGEYDDNGNWKCSGPSKPAALVIHGGSDDLGDYGKESRDFYRTANACKTTTKPTPPSPCVAYDGCAAGKPLTFCLVPNMGHQFWSASAPQAIWSFFASF